jgi:hypothetical protein
MYLKSDYLPLDRPASMFELPTVGRYSLLAPLLGRIRAQVYRKILVQHYHDPNFVYDWGNLVRPTGVRQALQDNYDEIRIIPALPHPPGGPAIQYDGPVSVLVPRPR